MFVRKRKMGLPAAFSIGDSWFDYPIYDNVIDLVDSMDFEAHLDHAVVGLGQGPYDLVDAGARHLLVQLCSWRS